LIEQEVKLAFDSVEAARRAVTTAGGRLLVSVRLLVDTLFDTADQRLRRDGCALRLRRDAQSAFLTFKGPAQPGEVKAREEIEFSVGNADASDALLRALGFRRWFLYEKYREEYAVGDARVMIDETPIGTFIEIEADPAGIARAASRLGRTRDHYRLESYARLYFQWCEDRGVVPGDMKF
jgi:adenylate cyclase class 2